MPTGDPQDSRDPNSPQWGYLKVDNAYQFDYPARDEHWNNFVMFVYDNERIDETKRINENDMIPIPKQGVKFEMVRATLTINKEDLPPEYSAENGPIQIPSGNNVPEETKLWVALVVGKV